MADYIPLFKPGSAVTFTAQSAIKGGQLVEVVGDRAVGPAGADSAKVAGVAGFDAAAGEHVVVYSGGVQRIAATGTVTAGARVAAAADGTIATEGTNTIGLALTAASEGDLTEIKLDH